MRAYVKRLPIVGRIATVGYRALCWGLRAASECYTLHRLANGAHLQGRAVAQVLRRLRLPMPECERERISAIEQQRKRLLRCAKPLVDGTLREAGPFDGEVTIQEAVGVSKLPKAALLMYSLIRTFKPRTVIELGTNVGISSAYLAAALKVNGQNGRLFTLEASPYRLRLAEKLHRELGLDNVTYVRGLFSDTLNTVLGECGAVDFAFVDGHHQYRPTLDYFNTIWNCSKKDGAVFVFDDIRWSDGMKEAWAELQADGKLGLCVDLHSMAVCVGAGESVAKRYQFAPMSQFLAEKPLELL